MADNVDELLDVEDGEGAAVEAEEVPAQEQEILDLQWYVIHTYSGYENKVKKDLERRIETMGMKGKIFRVLVPTEKETEFRDGKKKIVEKKIYPGYVLVEMVMTEDSWYVVRNTPGVTGFIGPGGSKPIPLPESEAKAILILVGELETPKLKIDLLPGQQVRVLHGPFQGYEGPVQEVGKEKVVVLIPIFAGRSVPVEVEIDKIEKLS